MGGFNPRYSRAIEYWGVNDLEFITTNYFYGKVGLQYNIINKIYLIGLFNYIDTEFPMSWIYKDMDQSLLGGKERRYGFGAGIAVETFIGPISISVAKDQYRNYLVSNLSIGFYF
jgi:hypothetical protein